MGYYRRFLDAIPHLGVHSIALLALSPLSPPKGLSFDLHALAMPPAFNLSQDQTLQLKAVEPEDKLPVYFNEVLTMETPRPQCGREAGLRPGRRNARNAVGRQKPTSKLTLFNLTAGTSPAEG
jgi:hypothetical protein